MEVNSKRERNNTFSNRNVKIISARTRAALPPLSLHMPRLCWSTIGWMKNLLKSDKLYILHTFILSNKHESAMALWCCSDTYVEANSTGLQRVKCAIAYRHMLNDKRMNRQYKQHLGTMKLLYNSLRRLLPHPQHN